ncbi:MAG: hypothetical protein M1818_000715 [Claussenomyces sp. TS43310]|nr:MAG: hypothetical protein M1818_000715 [Claussenomyces sp. TS43310]
MPPRIPTLSRLSASGLCLRPATKPSKPRSLPIIPVANASSQAKQRRYGDPWALANARQRKAANLTRQAVLKKERAAVLGDPVRGITTPFIRSLDDIPPPPALDAKASGDGRDSTQTSGAASATPLNHFLDSSELQQSLRRSYILSQPVISSNRNLQDPAREADDVRRHAEGHERAVTAMARIVNLNNGNQKDRTRVNIQRCIDTFGRHNTDSVLRPRAPSQQSRDPEKTPQADKTPRAGPDTGSSEVQIAILTAKIRVLANHMEKRRGDKINKRNLRVLVHKRQKHLAYLRRRERGGERWQNVVSTLGLTDGTWKGEISL